MAIKRRDIGCMRTVLVIGALLGGLGGGVVTAIPAQAQGPNDFLDHLNSIGIGNRDDKHNFDLVGRSRTHRKCVRSTSRASSSVRGAPLRRAVAAAAAGALAGRFFGAGLVLETVGLGQCSADSRLLRRRQADAARVPARVTWGRFGR
jgi:hypothetical protein